MSEPLSQPQLGLAGADLLPARVRVLLERARTLRSHLDAFGAALSSDDAVGRRLDFLVQELNREANTLSSKISDVAISQLAIDIKCEIEKIREQAQNIE